MLNGDGASRVPGVAVMGGIGSGKTAIVEQLVAYSCFSNSSVTAGGGVPLLHRFVLFHYHCSLENKSLCIVKFLVYS